MNEGKENAPDDKKHVEPELQQRILKVLNQARLPEDLVNHPLTALKPDVAKAILAHRDTVGPFGFTDLEQVRTIRAIGPNVVKGFFGAFGSMSFGAWSQPYSVQSPVNGTNTLVAHAALLHNGLVLFLKASCTPPGETILWDPSDETNPIFTSPSNEPDVNLYCCGHSFLSDGKLLVVGGGGEFTPTVTDTAWTFDPGSGGGAGEWTQTAGNMSVPRWYPTAVTLGGGRVLVASGREYAPPTHPYIDTLEIYQESTGTFVPVSGPPADPTAANRDLPRLYPGLHLLTGGEVFYSRTGWRDTGGTEPVQSSYFKLMGPTTGHWVEIDDLMDFPERTEGMSVTLLEPGGPHGWMAKVMVIGGGEINTTGQSTAEIIHTAALTPVWEPPIDIGDPRLNCNVVVLPDGKVFVCGGMSGLNTPCLMFDPDTNAVSPMANVQYTRAYHSVAVLLPSGKVAVTGGGSPVIEIFSPPYVFNGAPPTFASPPPTTVHHGHTFQVESPEAADIQKVVLVRPMAVTHQLDTEQRVIPLQFTQSGTTLNVTAPDGVHPHPVAPRGYYMLFILNGDGVPSKAEFVYLH